MSGDKVKTLAVDYRILLKGQESLFLLSDLETVIWLALDTMLGKDRANSLETRLKYNTEVSKYCFQDTENLNALEIIIGDNDLVEEVTTDNKKAICKFIDHLCRYRFSRTLNEQERETAYSDFIKLRDIIYLIISNFNFKKIMTINAVRQGIYIEGKCR